MSEAVSIRVIARFRPVNGREREEAKRLGWSTKKLNPFSVREERAVEVAPDAEQGRKAPVCFTTDHVLVDCDQRTAFETIALPTVKDCLRGINGTIFAYGQTGSGKTWSMFGPEISPEIAEKPENIQNMGIIPRSSFYVFTELSNHPKVSKFEVKITALEIYVGNQIRDLLHPQTASKNLRMREGQNGVFVQGLRPKTVSSVSDVLQCIELANAHRTVSATKMNATSSRSHSIFSFMINCQLVEGGKKQSKLNFADLAGSEKVGKTGATGHRLKEGAAINKSLTVLGRVIKALAKKELAPFRESSLTYILKDSLSGNTKTTLLVCLSPHRFNTPETINTLQFASRAKMIKNKVKVNKVLTTKDLQREIKRLQKEVVTLKDNLRKKATSITNVDAPKEGLPYCRLKISSQEEPSNDSQYILRRKEVQKEIKAIVQKGGLEGLIVETKIRRSISKEAKTVKRNKKKPAPSGLASISENEELKEIIKPLVVHLCFQPSESFSGENLIEAKEMFLAQMSNQGGLFASCEIEQGFADPAEYGSSLAPAVQRQIVQELNVCTQEKEMLEKQAAKMKDENFELQRQIDSFNVSKLDESEKIADLEEKVRLQEGELRKLKTLTMSQDIKSQKEFNSRPRLRRAHHKTGVNINAKDLPGQGNFLSPLLTLSPTSDSFGSYNFPSKPKRRVSRLRRTLSTREEFGQMKASDLFDVQKQMLDDFKIVCQELQTEDHKVTSRLIDIGTIARHTINQIQILSDEAFETGKDHESYISKLKEQLETRHNELDEAYLQLESFRSALENQELFLGVSGHPRITPRHSLEAGEKKDLAKEILNSDNADEILRNMLELPTGDPGITRKKVEKSARFQFPSPRNKLQSPTFLGHESYKEVVNLVSKKVTLLHREFAASNANFDVDLASPKSNATLVADDWFDDEKEVIDWDVDDVAKWLATIEDGALDRFIEMFEIHSITGEALLSLTRKDLKHDFNMEREHIKMFFKALARKDEFVRQRLEDTQRSKAKSRRKRLQKKVRGQLNVHSTFVVNDAYQKMLEREMQKEFGPKAPKKKLYPGDLVELANNRSGRVMFMGNLEGKDGDYIGVEVIKGDGKNNGSFEKKRYFKTLEGRGLFTRLTRIKKVLSIEKLKDLYNFEYNSDDDMADDESEKRRKRFRHHARGQEESESSSFDTSNNFIPVYNDSDSSIDFSLSESDSEDDTETVLFANHGRQFSAIPTTIHAGYAKLDLRR